MTSVDATNMQRPRVVFFDLAHTLVRGAPVSARRALGTRLNLNEKQVRQAGKLIMTHPATTPDQLLPPLQKIADTCSAHRIRMELEGLWQEQFETAEILNGAVMLLEAIKGAGIALGLISNTWHPFYEGFAQRHRSLKRLFDHEILSYRCGVKKPSSAIFELAVATSGFRADNAWMVGDSYELDMAPSQSLGMNTLWILCRPEVETEVLAKLARHELVPPRRVVDDLRNALLQLKDLGIVP